MIEKISTYFTELVVFLAAQLRIPKYCADFQVFHPFIQLFLGT